MVGCYEVKLAMPRRLNDHFMECPPPPRGEGHILWRMKWRMGGARVVKRVEETRSTMLSLNIVMTRDTVDSGVSHNALYVQYILL